MKWFKKKHSVCSECGVHFEPVTGYEARWGNLCSTHRKAVKERDERRDAVVSWAKENWERLEKMMEEDMGERKRKFNEMLQRNMDSMAKSQMQAQGQSNPLGLYGGTTIFPGFL